MRRESDRLTYPPTVQSASLDQPSPSQSINGVSISFSVLNNLALMTPGYIFVNRFRSTPRYVTDSVSSIVSPWGPTFHELMVSLFVSM